MRSLSTLLSTLVVLIAITWALPASAYKIIRDNSDSHNGTKVLVLPYAFSSEASGFGYGVGGGISGWPQEQAIVGGTVWRTSDSTDAIYLNMTDFQLPFAKRWFMTIHGFEGSYSNMVSYASGTGSDGIPPASNDSDRNSYHQGHGWDQWFEAEFSYVLPWGPNGDEPIHTYVTNKGILSEGGLYNGEYNPFASGRSYFKFKPFYRKRWYRDDAPNNSNSESIGARLTWEYDNTDFWYAPSEGSKTLVRWWQGLDNARGDNWTSLELDYSKFWSQSETDWFKKRVIGFNFWTVDTPSWDYKSDGTVTGESPYYMGANLGGYMRQRGFPFYRFHDKSAINYALEYRLTPKWNPLKKYQWFKWWEVVPFIEAGRVAHYWSPTELHTNMKVSGGVGLRLMILNSIIRFDTAASKEGMNVWAMVNQAF